MFVVEFRVKINDLGLWVGVRVKLDLHLIFNIN